MITSARVSVPVVIRQGLQHPGLDWHCRCGEKIHFEPPSVPDLVLDPGFDVAGPLTVQVVKTCPRCSYCASVIWEFLVADPEAEVE